MRWHPAKPLLPVLALSGVLLGALAACAPVQQPYPYGTGPALDRRVIVAVNFDFNSYRIRPDSFAALDNAALALNDPRLYGLTFEVNGHTDLSGRLGYNISLSMLRATAVADYLAARGVPRERMRPQGFGPLQLYDASDPRSPANRRVEIVAVR